MKDMRQPERMSGHPKAGRRRLGLAILGIAAILTVWLVWNRLGGSTRVALVNYNIITQMQMSGANDCPAVSLETVRPEEFRRLRKYDMVFVSGMGLKLTEEQRNGLREVSGDVPVMTVVATNPANDINSVPEPLAGRLKEYLDNGGVSNYRNLFLAVRKYVDRKVFRAPEPEPASEFAEGLLFDPSAGGREYCSVKEYGKWLASRGGREVKSGNIVLTGRMGEPAALAEALEDRGYSVWCVRDFRALVENGHIDSIAPVALVNMAHGRLGDYASDYLKKADIPYFAPLNVNVSRQEWESDSRGMYGGFLSQSIVMPETDGAVRPFALFAHVQGKDGLMQVEAMPERLEDFAEAVDRHVRLASIPEKDKKIAIFYYKGPGQNTLSAGGMEVVPSLFNLLKHLEREGYMVEGLPSTPEALGRILMERGPVFGNYAEGAVSRFLSSGYPVMVSEEEYRSWVSDALLPDKYAEVEAADGKFPGRYLAAEDGRLGIAAVRFGNVVLMPQPAAGYGDNAYKTVHGTEQAPPHEYVAAYLWARYGFGADALVHFGTHGSLEFTPGKQVALSSSDWPDRLVGPLPHIYVYSVSNVGEAMIAKRRSYATLVSYLTPPFMESGAGPQYAALKKAVEQYGMAEADGDTVSAGHEASVIRKEAMKLGIHRDLGLDTAEVLSSEDILRIGHFVEEVSSERVTGQLYVLGEPYAEDRIESTVKAVASAEPDNPDFPAEIRRRLLESPVKELDAIVRALDGGYVEPSPGGDPVTAPNVLPTGRNLFAVNAEATPSELAWEKGVRLARNTLEMYRKEHNDSLPRKVSYTFWSGEFVETEGATVAQVLYMLGVEPVRDVFGRVSDLRLIPSEELGRPRIDVLVQTSGQFRDIAASRLALIQRAVRMAAESGDDVFGNEVAEGVLETERILVEKGVSPVQARQMASCRVFGGVDGHYGTGITSLVESGDRWEDESEIAGTYMENMGAYYGDVEMWQTYTEHLFEAALSRTDVVVQPRQSNTWGALSLDHVYEFMGGLSLSVRNVTGRDPEAYLSDYRNGSRVRMQELREAVGVESRTTVFNPAYIREKMKGGAGAANTFAETVKNIYGWNVMKPETVDDALWEQIYETYVKDSRGLGVKEFFRQTNPAALEEMTAVMLESVRKGLWSPDGRTVADIADLHTDLVREFEPSCSDFVCDNLPLRNFIASKVDAAPAAEYMERISSVREAVSADPSSGVVMEKDRIDAGNGRPEKERTVWSGLAVALAAVAGVAVLVSYVVIRRKNWE